MLDINLKEIVTEVSAAFQRYEQALVSNDVAVLDELFWNSPHTLRFGVNENLFGYEAIASFRANRTPINLTRKLMNTVITTYGRDFATDIELVGLLTTLNTEFQREGSTMTGRQSHVWLRSPEGWRVVAAHVSLLPASPTK